MHIDHVTTHLVGSEWNCDMGELFAVLGSAICGALHITAMNEYRQMWENIPGCCDATNQYFVNARNASLIGIVFAVVSGVVTFLVSIVFFVGKNIERKIKHRLNIIRLALSNGYIVVSVLAIADETLFGRASQTAILEIIAGGLVGMGLLIFGLVKGDQFNTDDPILIFVVVLFFMATLTQVIVGICYLSLQFPEEYCWTNDSGVGDDTMEKGWMPCSTNYCGQLNVNATNTYSNSYGTVTEYCTVDCCYWNA